MQIAGRLPRRRRRLVGAYWASLIVVQAAYMLHDGLGFGGGGLDKPFAGWLQNALILAIGAGVLGRVVLVPAERLAWAFIGTAILAWGSGEIYWWQVLRIQSPEPFPSLADGLWLSFYPLAYAGLILMVRQRLGRRHWSLWIDGAIGALCVGAVGAALVLPPILASSTGSLAAVATNLAYPLLDTLMVALIVAVLALTGWRPGRTWGLLAAGFVIFGAADSIYLYRVSNNSYVAETIFDTMWAAGLLLIGCGAWQPSRRKPPVHLEGWRELVMPSAFALVALGVLVYDHEGNVSWPATAMAAATILAVMARTAVTFRENLTLAESRKQAVTDELTGLPNRRLFLDRAQQAILRARREGSSCAVMIMDLDRFKEINDTLGHHSGDVLLQTIAERLQGGLRESDTVARLGGDEFAVLLPRVGGSEDAEEVAQKLRELIARPVHMESLVIDAQMSVGVAVFPQHGTDLAPLMQHADVAMYQAKAGRTGQELYRPELDEYNPERLALAGELRQAIARDEIVLHYQPQLDLHNNAVASVEALVRWQHPTRGLLAPGEFIPLAEHTALIRPLTVCVLEQALRQCSQWEREQGLVLTIAVNLSAHHLLDMGLPNLVADLLARFELPPQRLELEITEGTLMHDPERALTVLTALTMLGVGLSIDDFGTGYSSLSYLKELPVHALKIDRSFVAAMRTRHADAMIVRSTVDLGRNLGLRVVAEGIETAETLEELRALGCDLAQGFYISRPVPAGELPAAIRGAAEIPRSTGGSLTSMAGRIEVGDWPGPEPALSTP